MPLQNVTLWHKDYFEPFILRNSRHRRGSENREVSLLLETFIFKKEISIHIPPLRTRKTRMTLNHKRILSLEKALNL